MIKIEYDGKYPNLCSGNLTVWLNDKRYEFGRCLASGGEITHDDDYNFEIFRGRWYWRECNEIPEDFPKDRLQDVLDVVNETVEWGCCGGCS